MARRPLAASQQGEPQPPTTSTPSVTFAATDAGVPTGSSIVPVNISLTTPTASARTMSAASGANGRPNITLAGTDSGARGCSREAIPASPYQARALTRPLTAATPSAAAVPRCATTAAAADSTPKLTSSQPTARSGGSRRHQAAITPP